MPGALVDTRKVFEDLSSTYLPIAGAVFAIVMLQGAEITQMRCARSA